MSSQESSTSNEEGNSINSKIAPIIPPMRQPSQTYECCVKGCPLAHHSERIVCFVPQCEKEIHWHCYESFILKGSRKNTMALDHFLPDNFNVAACSRRHVKQAATLSKKVSAEENMGWTEDGHPFDESYFLST